MNAMRKVLGRLGRKMKIVVNNQAIFFINLALRAVGNQVIQALL